MENKVYPSDNSQQAVLTLNMAEYLLKLNGKVKNAVGCFPLVFIQWQVKTALQLQRGSLIFKLNNLLYCQISQPCRAERYCLI